MAERTSEAQWEGTLKDGKGRFWTGSGEVSGVYTYGTRFEDRDGTNPEELIAAAHASCFSMALAADLEKAGHRPESVRTSAAVTLEKGDDGYRITGISLDAQAQVGEIDGSELRRIADRTAETCPVSKGLASVPIRVRAELVS